MRSLICLIAVLMITAPALATVNFNVSASGTQVTIGYASDPGDQVRGVALKLTYTLGNRVNTVDSIATEFNTFIDYAYDDPCGYTVGDDGGDLRNCLAKDDGPGVDTVGPAVLPTVICLGVLDESGGQASGPGTTDNMITFTLDNQTPGTLTIAADTLRSETGAVGSDLATNLPITIELPAASGCFDPEHADYDYWVAAGEPSCFCYMHQCQGDADGIKHGSSKTGYYRVGAPDLSLLLSGWKILEPTKGPGLAASDPEICADFERDLGGSSKTGYYRVGATDLSILLANWKVLDPTKGPGLLLDTCGGDDLH
ncbi:MAG: hypothetical protein JW860_11905 [Sedimentisphaerales bacterium]|nr:hypothetical protein [Sedimentisphaerales bacterium]